MARGEAGEAVYTPEVSPLDLPRKITPEAVPQNFGSGIAQAFGQIGDTLDRKYQADSATWAGDQLADARVKAINALEQAKANAPAGDQTGFTDKYLAGFDKDTIPLAQQAQGNPVASQILTKGLTDLRQTLQMHTMEWEAQQNVAYRQDSLQQNLDKQLPLVRLHPEIADSVGATLNDQAQAAGMQPAEHLKWLRAMDSQLTANAALGLADKNPGEVYQQLQSGEPSDPTLQRLTDPKARQAVLDQAQAGVVGNLAQGALAQYRSGGPDVGAKAYTAVDNLNLPDEVKDQVRQQIQHGLTALNQEQRQKYANQITQLDVGIASGNLPANARASADSLYRNNALDQQQYAAALSGIDRAEKKDDADTESLARGIAAFTNRQPLDPKNTEDQNAVSLLFDQMVAKAPPGSDQFTNSAVAITDHVGLVPKDVISWARASIVGGNAQDAAAAASVLGRIQETNPRAYALAFDGDSKTSAMVASINEAVKAGADPEATVNLARQNATMPKSEQELLNAKWGTVKSSNSIAAAQPAALGSILESDKTFKPGWFTGVPAVPPLMQGEFDQLTRDYYDKTGGNVDTARQLAAQDLKRTWGVSEVNGKREIMQYAPEAMFPGLTASVVREDVAKTVADNAVLHGIDPSKVRLTATDRTARTGGTDWALSAPDHLGAYDVVRGKDGNPLTYRLPVASNDYAAVKAREAAADLQAARDKQALGRDAKQRQMQEVDDQRGAPMNRLNY